MSYVGCVHGLCILVDDTGPPFHYSMLRISDLTIAISVQALTLCKQLAGCKGSSFTLGLQNCAAILAGLLSVDGLAEHCTSLGHMTQ